MNDTDQQLIHQGKLIRIGRGSNPAGGGVLYLSIIDPASGNERAIAVDVECWSEMVTAFEDAADDLNSTFSEELDAGSATSQTRDDDDDDDDDLIG